MEVVLKDWQSACRPATAYYGPQVAKLLGEKWRALDAEGKAEYQAAAAEQAAAMKEQRQQPSAAAPHSDEAPEVCFLVLCCKYIGGWQDAQEAREDTPSGLLQRILTFQSIGKSTGKAQGHIMQNLEVPRIAIRKFFTLATRGLMQQEGTSLEPACCYEAAGAAMLPAFARPDHCSFFCHLES